MDVRLVILCACAAIVSTSRTCREASTGFQNGDPYTIQKTSLGSTVIDFSYVCPSVMYVTGATATACSNDENLQIMFDSAEQVTVIVGETAYTDILVVVKCYSPLASDLPQYER